MRHFESSDFQLRDPDFQLRLTHLMQQEAHSPVAVMKSSGLVRQLLGKLRVDSGSATPDVRESVVCRPGDERRCFRDRLGPGWLQHAV